MCAQPPSEQWATHAVCYRVRQNQVTASWGGAETPEPLKYQMCNKQDAGINKTSKRAEQPTPIVIATTLEVEAGASVEPGVG